MIDVEQTGFRIKLICMKKGYTVRSLSELLFTSEKTIRGWFSGKRPPSLHDLCLLSDVLDMKLDDLVVQVKIR